MKYVIRHTLRDKSQVFYNVERGDYGALNDATQFQFPRDANLLAAGLREDPLRLKVVPV
jgi:hypothetical protein